MTDQPISILIAEDDHDFRDSSLRWMRLKGHHVAAVSSGTEALRLCEQESFEVGIFDMNMPDMTGVELLQKIHASGIELEAIILTGQGSIESAVAAMKKGASDYLTKPCPLGDLEHHCELARDRGRLRSENRRLKAFLSRTTPKLDIVGESLAMLRVKKLVNRIGPTDKPVLITGESGTGKEVVAKALQQVSGLQSMPFVTINCAALPESLVESELFGYQKGAFTGASQDKAGLFEVADGGTLFIDELGELPLSLQPKLLRVLEDGSMRRIGSHRERTVHVRIIAATNRSLADDVKAGRFREDLYYRVNVLPIELPSLRDRHGDIDLLIDHFLKAPWRLAADARRAMNGYRWPGNVRELINVLERGKILADAHELTLNDLPRELLNDSATGGATAQVSDSVRPGNAFVGEHPSQAAEFAEHRTLPSSEIRLDEIAKSHVLAVLHKHNGNKAQTARALGIHRRKLYRLLERFQQKAESGSQTFKSTSRATAT